MLGAMTLSSLLPAIEALARRAGACVMAIYAEGDGAARQLRHKADASPVTAADEQAEALILAGLAGLTPDIPVVAEESVAAGRVPDIAGGRFWLVDPLDGTREFVSRNGEFTVNLALIDQGLPVLGVVLAPALDGGAGRLWSGWTGPDGRGAWVEDHQGRRPMACRAVPPAGLSVLASRSHGDAAALQAFLAGRVVAESLAAGSSLKLCWVAEGRADLYPRLGRTMEWDIAAGDAVLRAAGGGVWRLDDGRPLDYGKPGFANPHFCAAACAATALGAG